MLKRAAQIAFLILIPLSALAMPKGRESTTVQVASSTTRIHRSSSGDVFTYTDLMFIEVNGKKVVYECVQRGNICPLLDSEKTYTADREGIFIYISMNLPDDNKAFPVKFRQVGSW